MKSVYPAWISRPYCLFQQATREAVQVFTIAKSVRCVGCRLRCNEENRDGRHVKNVCGKTEMEACKERLWKDI